MIGNKNVAITIPEPEIARLLFGDSRMAWIWLIFRWYIGYEWFMAGWDKLTGGWIGANAGTAIRGFFHGVLQQSLNSHPSVSYWYGAFIANVAIPHAIFFSYLVAFGELAVGIGLILGAFTGIAAFFGVFMNFNYLFAGVVSTNPMLIIIEIFFILAWRNAGLYGLDRWLLPWVGVPWRPGSLSKGMG